MLKPGVTAVEMFCTQIHVSVGRLGTIYCYLASKNKWYDYMRIEV
jgi:hypothetical protein